MVVCSQHAKRTIYRWWPSRTAVVLDALVEGTMQRTPFPASDDLRNDFRLHLEKVTALFNSPTGAIIRELVAEGQSDDHIADEFRKRFWAPRRNLSRTRLEHAIEHGRIRPDIDIELVLDTTYGALWLRLLIGHLPMRPGDARKIIDSIWDGIEMADQH